MTLSALHQPLTIIHLMHKASFTHLCGTFHCNTSRTPSLDVDGSWFGWIYRLWHKIVYMFRWWWFQSKCQDHETRLYEHRNEKKSRSGRFALFAGGAPLRALRARPRDEPMLTGCLPLAGIHELSVVAIVVRREDNNINPPSSCQWFQPLAPMIGQLMR